MGIDTMLSGRRYPLLHDAKSLYKRFSSKPLTSLFLIGHITICGYLYQASIVSYEMESAWGKAGGSLDVVDRLLLTFDPSYGIPYVWILCSVPVMIWVSRAMPSIKEPRYLVAFGTPALSYASRIAGFVACSLACGACAYLAACFSAYIQLSICAPQQQPSAIPVLQTLNTTSPDGFFANMFGRPLNSSPNLLLFHIFNYLYCVGTICISLVGMLALEIITGKAWVGVTVMALLGMPIVHSSTSFIYDIVRNISGGVLAGTNPLAYVYERWSIAHISWSPVVGHGVAAFAGACLCLVMVSLAVMVFRDSLD